MSESVESAVAGPNPIDPMFYFRLLVRRRWIIVTFWVLAVGGTSVHTLQQPKVFQASASIIMDANTPKILDKQLEEVVEPGPTGYWFSKEYYETQYKVIVSRAVAQRVVDKLGLQNDASFLGYSDIKDEKLRAEKMKNADAAGYLQSLIKVQPAKDTRLAYVIIEDADPSRAALLANEITQAYIAENLALKLQTTENASEWLEDRLSSLEEKSHKSELSLYDFKKDADMLTTSVEDRQSMVSQKLNSLNQALIDVRMRIAGLRAHVDTIRGVQAAATNKERWAEELPAAKSSGLVEEFKLRLAAQEVDCAELRGRYLEDHPKLVTCREKVKAASADLLRELGNIVGSAEAELREALSKERNLDGLFAAAKAEAFEVNKKQIEFEQIKREADNNQRLHEMVLKRLKEIELSGLLRTSNVRILDSARPNFVPVRPKVRNTILMSAILGLLGGLALAFVLEFLDNSITSQAEIEEKLGVPFLGFVPSIPEERATTITERDLHIHSHPKSAVAECCRAIRTNLLFMTPDKPFKSLLISSSGPQEGKSTSVINLGIAMAQSGNRVILLDTDMRRPRLHKAFGVPNDIGVSSVVVDPGKFEDAIKSTEVPGLFVLPCGPVPPNPAELLHTQAFSELLRKLSDRFDKIILDSPPLGAVADAAVLSTKADGVLLVLKAGKTSRELARRAVRSVMDVNAKLLGVILNNIDLRDRKYGDYYYAYRTYGQYYGEKKGEVTS
ncbi:MAG: GumC family protein [Myxococcaceae bacterium]